MEWSREKTLNLIEEYRKQECLWNQTIVNYKDKQKRLDAWREIAKIFECEWVEVEKKMKITIGQFQREMKKLKGQSRDGVVDDDNSRWFAFKSLLFLRDKWKPHKTTDASVEKQLSSGEEGEEITNHIFSADEAAAAVQMVGEMTQTKESPCKYGGKKVFKLPTKRKRTYSATNMFPSDDQSKMVMQAYDVMNTISSNWQYRDDSQVFGDYVASKLRPLKACAKNTVQHMINDILYSATLGRYDQPSLMERFGDNNTQDLSSTSTSGQNTPVQSPYPKDTADDAFEQHHHHETERPTTAEIGGSEALSTVLAVYSN